MNKKLNRLFPKVVGVYTFDNHNKYEKELVSKCDSIKNRGTDIGGQNWISQSVYNTENVYDVNKDKDFDPITNFIRSYNLSSWIRTNPPIFENSFNNISSSISSLKDNLNIQMIHGYSKATDELLMEWMEQIADNCTDLDKVGTYRAITGQNGINFSEIIHKTLLGSVVY